MTAMSPRAMPLRQKVLVRWCNLYLDGSGDSDSPIDSLCDMSDGIQLMALLHALCGSDPSKGKKVFLTRPLSRDNKVTNVHVCVMFMNRVGVSLFGIRPDDLASGRLTMWEELVWNMIVHFELNPLLRKRNVSAIPNLIELIVRYAASLIDDIDQFHFPLETLADFRDGAVLCQIMSQSLPERFDVEQLNAPKTPASERWIAIARTGVPLLIHRSEIMRPDSTERCWLAFLAVIFSNLKNRLSDGKFIGRQTRALTPTLAAGAAEDAEQIQRLEEELAEKKTQVTALQVNLRMLQAVNRRLVADKSKLNKTRVQVTEAMVDNARDVCTLREQVARLSEDLILARRKITELQTNQSEKSESETVTPPSGKVTLVGIHIQNSAPLWEADANVMAQAVYVYIKLVRQHVAQYGGYESKLDGTAFTIAFGNPFAAVQMCLDLQLNAVNAAWPKKLGGLGFAGTEVDEDGLTIFCGLRLRMGIHTAEPLKRPDPTFTRVEYVGHAGLICARVTAAADGGQILLTAAAHDAIRRVVSSFRHKPEVELLGGFTIKGVNNRLTLYQILPMRLSKRVFEPPRTSPERVKAHGSRENMYLVKELEDDIRQSNVERLRTTVSDADRELDKVSNQLLNAKEQSSKLLKDLSTLQATYATETERAAVMAVDIATGFSSKNDRMLETVLEIKEEQEGMVLRTEKLLTEFQTLQALHVETLARMEEETANTGEAEGTLARSGSRDFHGVLAVWKKKLSKAEKDVLDKDAKIAELENTVTVLRYKLLKRAEGGADFDDDDVTVVDVHEAGIDGVFERMSGLAEKVRPADEAVLAEARATQAALSEKLEATNSSLNSTRTGFARSASYVRRAASKYHPITRRTFVRGSTEDLLRRKHAEAELADMAAPPPSATREVLIRPLTEGKEQVLAENSLLYDVISSEVERWTPRGGGDDVITPGGGSDEHNESASGSEEVLEATVLDVGDGGVEGEGMLSARTTTTDEQLTPRSPMRAYATGTAELDRDGHLTNSLPSNEAGADGESDVELMTYMALPGGESELAPPIFASPRPHAGVRVLRPHSPRGGRVAVAVSTLDSMQERTRAQRRRQFPRLYLVPDPPRARGSFIPSHNAPSNARVSAMGGSAYSGRTPRSVSVAAPATSASVTTLGGL